MANEDKLKQQQDDTTNAESNAERDQDAGNMNNGTIGGNMGVIGGSSNEDEERYGKQQHVEGTTVARDTDGGATEGSKA